MNKILYEDLNKLNSQYLKEYILAIKKIFKNEYFILGNNLNLFQKNFAKFHNIKYCVGVNSGLDALFLSLKALNLKKNSEVILPSNCYVAAVLAVINAGLKPVFVEPDINTYNIDPELITRKITSKTKVIMVVHLYGKPCKMDKINQICKKNNLYLIEDCAQAHGAQYKSKLVGTFGDFGCFSFFPTKNLGAVGDGGAILINKKRYANELHKLRNYGSMDKNKNEVIGFNSRLDEIQAAFLNIKFKNLEKINSHKRKLANIYSENLDSKFIKPSLDKNIKEVHHIYPIRFHERSKLINYLKKNNINTLVHYPTPPYLQPFYKKKEVEKYEISDEIHKTILSLPISTIHSEQDIYKITKILNKF